jgi:hypothetical protein
VEVVSIRRRQRLIRDPYVNTALEATIRWRVSFLGRRVMAAALKLCEVAYPSLYAEAA